MLVLCTWRQNAGHPAWATARRRAPGGGGNSAWGIAADLEAGLYRSPAGAFAILSRGEVSEWLKVPLSKSGVRKHRGFESHPLRHVRSTPDRVDEPVRGEVA